MKNKSRIWTGIILCVTVLAMSACGKSGAGNAGSNQKTQGSGVRTETQGGGELKNEVTVAEDDLVQIAGSYVSDKQLMLLGDSTSGKTKLAYLCDKFVVVLQLDNPIEEDGFDYESLNQRETAWYATINQRRVQYFYDEFGLETPTDFQTILMDTVNTVNGGNQVIVKEDGVWMIYYCEKQPDVYYMANQFACFGGPQWLGIRCESLEEAESLLEYVKTRCKVYEAAQTGDGKYDYTDATDSEGNKLDISEIVYMQDRYVEYVKKHSGCTYTKDMTIIDNFGSITYKCGTSTLSVDCDERLDMESIRNDEDSMAVDYHGMTVYASKNYNAFYYEFEVDGEAEVVSASYYIFMGDENHNLSENSSVEDKLKYILDTFM